MLLLLRTVLRRVETVFAPALGRAGPPRLEALAVVLATPGLLALAEHLAGGVFLDLVGKERVPLLVALFIATVAALALVTALDPSLEALAVLLQALALRALANGSRRLHSF